MSTVELMRGRNDAAIANCEHLYPLAAGEPDLYIRAHALTQCHTVLSLCGGLVLLPDLQRDVTDLIEKLGNHLLLATFTLSLGIAASTTNHVGSDELLLHAYTLNEEYGGKVVNATAAVFLALHDLRAGHYRHAARWTRRALELAVTYGPSYIAQGLNVTVPIVKRQAPNDAAVLLGALRAHRVRRNQTGSEQEVANETRQVASLRRALGNEFDTFYARGLALSEADTLTLAFTHLDAVIDEA